MIPGEGIFLTMYLYMQVDGRHIQTQTVVCKHFKRGKLPCNIR
jgi:hypothetical protein